ncbi:MAG: hypothetical protein PVH84_03805 [Candidatus Aminicenantes bacterium]|jgi:hypothetical protein
MNTLSLIYQFLVGGVIFAAGVYFAWSSKDYSWKKREDRLTLLYMVAGFVLYCLFQTLWHFHALGKI